MDYLKNKRLTSFKTRIKHHIQHLINRMKRYRRDLPRQRQIRQRIDRYLEYLIQLEV